MSADTDPVVAEIRRIREAYASKFDFDITRIAKDAQEREAAGGRKVVSFPPRRPLSWTTPEPQAEPDPTAKQ